MALHTFSIDANPVAAATAETIIEVGTSSGNRAKIVEWWVEFDGVTATAIPVKVEVGRFSAAITTGTTGTSSKYDPADATPESVIKHTVTTEGAGTAEAGIEIHRIHPQGGFLKQYPLGRETVLAASTFWRIRVTAAAIVNVTAGVTVEDI
jgi:hypothetical protein